MVQVAVTVLLTLHFAGKSCSREVAGAFHHGFGGLIFGRKRTVALFPLQATLPRRFTIADGNPSWSGHPPGIWQVAYNAENRPVRFVNESAKTSGGKSPTTSGAGGTPAKWAFNVTVRQLLRYMYRRLPANSRHRCRQRSLPMVPVLGPDAAWGCAPAGHPQVKTAPVTPTGGIWPRSHGNLRENSRLPADGLHLHVLLTEKPPPKGTSPSP